MEFSKAIKFALAIICCIGIILAIALPIASLKSLDATEVGFSYSTVSISIDESQLYTAGRHFIGVGNEFIIYNTQYQRIELDNVTCISSDGLKISISAGFQYSLMPTLIDLLDLFYYWPFETYQDGYKNMAINVFRDTISKFTAFDFVYKRSIVESCLVQNITASLANYHANVQNFQLLDVEFPKSFSNAISETQNANLTIQSAVFNQSTVQNQVEGTILKAQTDAIVITNNAQIVATNILQATQGAILALQEKISRIQASLKIAKETLKLTNDALITYQWIKSLKKVTDISKSGDLIINLSTPKDIRCMADKTACS